ncbi:Uncharacterised protein [Mycobacteroides abscessus subsp. abscessus]|uniref:hypothetical protein n=1 Tax=Mycobacteroides abscessus TaxID=36809 RepID=UPI0009A777D9|nr:hypothetical protein [Mycobacteroides abscessus]SLD66875.1 Uncharacterised protein [Mycobacteroides abscessus subsp. abscessus]
MTWLSAALPYVGGGVLGAAFTYGLTWVRERRRTLDAYRAPQRQAIGDIVASTHELMLRELESRTTQTEMIQHIRQDVLPSAQLVGQLWATAAALGKATLDADRALQIGRLTIVDAPCWEAMWVAYVALSSLRQAMAARVDAPDMRSADEIVRYVEDIRVLADRYNESVLALVVAAADRVSPAETVWNRRRRRAARRRLGERFVSATEALQRTDDPRQPQEGN